MGDSASTVVRFLNPASMPPAFPVTSTNSFPAVTDLCFSAFRIPSIFGLPSAITEIQESSVAFIEIVKACFETRVESEDVGSEEDPCLVVESLAAVFDAVSESLLEGEGAGEATFPPGAMEFFFSAVGLGDGGQLPASISSCGRAKIIADWKPPNPLAVDSAASTRRSRATFGV